MYLQAIKGLGGNPVVIPPTDVYIALERNVVDGYCWPEVGIRDWGWQKQTKYMVEPTFYTGPNPLVMNLKTFEKLPKNLQDVLTEATAEAEKEVVAYYKALARTEPHCDERRDRDDHPAARGEGQVPENRLR